MPRGAVHTSKQLQIPASGVWRERQPTVELPWGPSPVICFQANLHLNSPFVAACAARPDLLPHGLDAVDQLHRHEPLVVDLDAVQLLVRILRVLLLYPDD